MAFYGLVLAFTILLVLIYLGAFFTQMSSENAILSTYASSYSIILPHFHSQSSRP